MLLQIITCQHFHIHKLSDMKKYTTTSSYIEDFSYFSPQVCHNKSGEINPTKIRGLVQGYIKKVKYYRKKQIGLSEPPPTKPTAIDPSAPFILIPKAAKPPTPIKSKA